MNEFGSFVVWDKDKNALGSVIRDEVGKYFVEKGIKPVLDADEYEISDLKGNKLKVRTVDSILSQYIKDNFDPETVSKINLGP